MPIAKLNASDAIAQSKSNTHSRWPQRGTPNHLSPLAKPNFTPGFRLPQGGTVFTIGSCFARNIERVLQEQGFKLPALDLLNSEEDFKQIGNNVLNNYGAPSICNELTWAFEDDINEEACFYKVGNGWVDLHLNNTMRPTELDRLRLRRRALNAAYRSIETCDAVIITLGLSEVWFDTRTGYYLNTAPRRTMLRADPDRFELHVLSYEETISSLRRSVELIRDKGRPDVRIVLTVSPVPMAATYRDVDVMVANTYSKSVLRSAAEDVVQSYDFVDYFPSYESIILSERQQAYQDDNIHPTREVIELNIGRMVRAYTGEPEALTLEDALANVSLYRANPKMGFEALCTNIDLCADPRIAEIFTECAISMDRFDVAEVVITLAQDPTGLLQAQICASKNQFEAALDAMRAAPDDKRLLTVADTIKVRAKAKLGRYDDAVAASEAWARRTPNSTSPFTTLARTLAEDGDARADIWYERALASSGGAAGVRLEYADHLTRTGQMAKAREMLDKVVHPSDREKKRKLQLMRALGAVT